MPAASKPPADAAAEGWKKKYQTLLVELDQHEQHSRASAKHLAGIAQLLASALPSDDPGLRASLQNILAASGEKPLPARLPVQIDAFAQKLQALQAERQQHATAAIDAILELSGQLQQAVAAHSAEGKGQLKALRNFGRQLRKEKPGSANAHERAAALRLAQLQLIQREFIDSLTSSHERSEGWLSRWLGGRSKPAQSVSDATADGYVGVASDTRSAPLASSDAPVQAVAAAAELADSTTGAAQSLDKTLSDEVAAILVGLVAGIEVPVASQPQLRALYADLQNGLNLAELVPVLDTTAELVNAALRRDQTEFEAFLAALEQRLEFFNRFVGELSGQLEGIAGHSQQFDAGMAEQLQQLRGVVEKSQAQGEPADNGQTIEQLQARVSASLDAVAGLLGDFGAGQRQHIAGLEAQLAELKLQISGLEQERTVAQQNIAAQRDKLLRDALTGVANREAYEIKLEDEYKRWKRYQRPLTLVVADIDLFKSINDNYGHAAGDRVLKIIAKVMSQQLRESDFVARYGGEEFVFLLPETDLDAAAIGVEKVRQAIESSPFNFKQQPVKVTCSFGLACFSGDDSMQSVFNRADQAMYRAKAAGRNRLEKGLA